MRGPRIRSERGGTEAMGQGRLAGSQSWRVSNASEQMGLSRT